MLKSYTPLLPVASTVIGTCSPIARPYPYLFLGVPGPLPAAYTSLPLNCTSPATYLLPVTLYQTLKKLKVHTTHLLPVTLPFL
jgi:hypothetical protein